MPWPWWETWARPGRTATRRSRSRGREGPPAHPVAVATVEPVFVLGVDPGLSRCGYCVLRIGDGAPRAAALGVMRTDPDMDVPRRLAELRDDFRGLLDEFEPRSVAVERVLFQVNVRTAMGVGQASGVLMAEAAARGAEVVEYSPNQVKDAVAGHGDADKEQVQKMVQILLDLPAPPHPPDAADAAAVALTHVAMSGVLR
ncbi:MAG: crossover junction endodeoxyribonuclease RuvC [Microthrixaceae bacterium]|nr:crossover junction endodeoxyribonuclease RuvC [Microthrixaceae bacterium]MCB9402167.1 crossover junction endodeoxyribonuclease RuvC [Microthrixaceae bacterium]